MILSERELELSQEHEGIMLLSGRPAAGHAAGRVLPIADQVMEFEITSNRPDCLGVYGVAREVVGRRSTPISRRWPGTEPRGDGRGTVADYVSARIDAPDLCPRWAGRVFTDVTVGPSPPWLKARIAAAGMRPISNVVDITNYVMLCLGEPTHAFDLDKVAGRQIIVRRARDGERVVTLDGQERTLDTEMLVIGDAEKPSAIAGLMGSEWSEVRDPDDDGAPGVRELRRPRHAGVLRCGWACAPRARARWEKGLDPHLVPRALALASQLMVELCGARLVPGTIDVHERSCREPPVVALRRERARASDRHRVHRRARRPGPHPARLPGRRTVGWRVPTWRAADTTREVDLIEEVARIDGIWKVPDA